MVEALARNWHYCQACRRCFLLDAAGKLVRSALTNHDLLDRLD